MTSIPPYLLFDVTVKTMQSDKTRWWPICHDDHECVGKVQLSIGSIITLDETHHMKV